MFFSHIFKFYDFVFLEDFTISIAEPDLVDKFNYANAFTPWMLKFLTRSRGLTEGSTKFPFVQKESKTLINILVYI